MNVDQVMTQLNILQVAADLQKPTPELRAQALTSVKASFAAAKLDYTWEDQIKNIETAWTKTGLNPDRCVLVMFLTDKLPVDAQQADAMLTEMPSAPEWTDEGLACIGDPEKLYAYMQRKAKEIVEALFGMMNPIAPSTNTVQ